MVELSVVIPAYLEAANLRLILPRLHAHLSTLNVATEILVIDSREPLDETQDICAGHQALYVNRSGGNGYGDAVRSGIARAQGRCIVFMDADGSHPPEFIARLYACAASADIVIASRYVAGGGSRNSPLLLLQSRMLNYIYSRCLGLPCRDISNSLRLYDGKLLRQLTLQCRHFDIVEEILVRSALANPDLRITELPFMFEKRVHGRTKRRYIVFLASFILTLIRLLALRRAALRTK